jgi:hypothetical protein
LHAGNEAREAAGGASGGEFGTVLARGPHGFESCPIAARDDDGAGGALEFGLVLGVLLGAGNGARRTAWFGSTSEGQSGRARDVGLVLAADRDLTCVEAACFRGAAGGVATLATGAAELDGGSVLLRSARVGGTGAVRTSGRGMTNAGLFLVGTASTGRG